MAAYDFVARKQRRREFLLNYLTSQENQVQSGSGSDDDFEEVKKPSQEQIVGQGRKLGEMF